MDSLYPEHEKMREVKNDADTIAAFLEWLEEQEMFVAILQDDADATEGYRAVPADLGIEKLLAKYFAIDLEKIGDEKDQMLADFRALNEKNKRGA